MMHLFADVSKTSEHGQVGVLAGLLFGRMRADSLLYLNSSLYHRANRPLKIILAAEILFTTKGVDEFKMVAHAYGELLRMRRCVKV